MEPLDLIIAGVIVLFILSVIVEKITSLVRSYVAISYLPFAIFTVLILLVVANYLTGSNQFAFGLFVIPVFAIVSLIVSVYLKSCKNQKFKDDQAKFLYNYFSDVNPESVNPDEKKKEKKIFLLSLSIGVLVSFSFRVDIFQIFTADDITTSFGWLSENFQNKGKYIWFSNMSNPHTLPSFTDEIQAFAGILITGFFLSFGSKFFHDLLDTLFLIKNHRKKLTEKETYDVNSMTVLIERLEEDELKSNPSVIGYSKEFIANENKAIAFIDKNASNKKDLPKELTISKDGKKISVPLEIQEVSEPEVQSTDQIPKLRNKEESNIYSFGSLSCVVKSKYGSQQYILSCYHVMRKGHNWDFFSLNEDDSDYITILGLDGKIANESMIVNGILDDNIDAAIAQIDGFGHKNKINGVTIHNIKSIEELPDNDACNINFAGATSGIKVGRVVNKNVNIRFRFDKEKRQWLHGLFSVSKINQENHEKISKGGDSGGLFYTDDGYAVGILIGANDSYSFGIPIKTIFEKLKIELT